MKRLALIMLVLVALGGVATWFLTRPKAAPVTEFRVWSGTLEPDLVRTVTIHWPDGTAAAFTRNTVGDGWILKFGNEPAWPVSPSRVRGALRLIANATGSAGPPPDEQGPAATTLEISTSDATSRVVHIGRGALGGRVPMWVSEGVSSSSILADAALAKLFEPEGVATWGEPTLIIGVGEPARATLTNASGDIQLSRTQARWSLLKPILARADATACRVVMQRWGEIQTTRWLSGPETPEMGFTDHPFATLQEETEVRFDRGDSVSRTRVTQEVAIGATAGSGQRYVRAQGWCEAVGGARTSQWGPRLGLISQTDADAFNITSAGLLTRRAADMAGADVKFVSVARGDEPAGLLTATLIIDGWKSGTLPLSSADALGVQGLTKLLCETDAATAVTDSPAGLKQVARVRVGVSQDASVELTMSRAQVPLKEGNQPVLLVSDGKVTWMYPEAAWGELMGWLTR
ncbi:MAG: hypothetical protein WC718_05005 [Phycisphaerales bacterium]